MTRSIKRATTVVAFAAAAAFAIPALAHAAPTLATVTVEPGTNSAKVTIHAPDELIDAGNCQGPWVHTAEDAKLIDESPVLDLVNNPQNWLVGNPASPTVAEDSQFTSYAYLKRGETKTLTIPFLREGDYVAGVVCLDWDGKAVYTLARVPFTVGSLTTVPGSSAGGSGSLNFGS